MRGRPDIDLRLPPVVRPGDEVAIEIVATSHSDTPIDFFDVTFAGDERVALQREGTIQENAREIARGAERLRDKGVLAAGEHRFNVRFAVPLDAPASYLGMLATIRYEVRLHVSIPWWPDLRETYELLVEPHPTSRPKPAPASTTSEGGSGVPFIELSLADTHFAANDEVSGAFATGNVGREAAEGVEISLVAVEVARHEQRVFQSEIYRHNLPSVFRVGRSGRETPFRFRVPKDVIPGFESATCRVDWALTATLRRPVQDAVIASIPVVIGRYAGGKAGAGRLPDVGAARWRAGWGEAGEPYGLVVDEERLRLTGSRGDVRMQVEVYEGEVDAALSARFSYPSLMLGLRVAPHLIVMLPTAVELMFPGHRIEHRELEQARAFLGGALREAIGGMKLVSADDASLVLRGPVAGHDRQSVAPFLRQVSAIADALCAAIEAVPPPAAMRDALPAWQAFAAATGGRLTVGGMVLRGASVDGTLFDVWTLLGSDGDASGTRVRMKVDPPLPLSAPVSAEAAELPPGCHEIVERLRAGARRLDIRPEALAIELAGGTLDPAALRPVMIEMFVLARRLRGDRSPGPYR